MVYLLKMVIDDYVMIFASLQFNLTKVSHPDPFFAEAVSHFAMASGCVPEAPWLGSSD